MAWPWITPWIWWAQVKHDLHKYYTFSIWLLFLTLRFNGIDPYRFLKKCLWLWFRSPQMLLYMVSKAFSDRFSPVAAKRRQQAASWHCQQCWTLVTIGNIWRDNDNYYRYNFYTIESKWHLQKGTLSFLHQIPTWACHLNFHQLHASVGQVVQVNSDVKNNTVIEILASSAASCLVAVNLKLRSVKRSTRLHIFKF